MTRTLVLGLLALFCLCVLFSRLTEGYPLGSQGAALYCYWAPPPFPGAATGSIPTQRTDPGGTFADSPAYGDLVSVGRSAASSSKTQNAIGGGGGGGTFYENPGFQAAYTSTAPRPTIAPLGALSVAPTPPVPAQTTAAPATTIITPQPTIKA